MGRCGGWLRIGVLLLAAFVASCGGTGGGSSDSGQPFVFQTRGRLNLIVQPVTNDPTVLTIIATLLDPQGNPFRNQRITFEAEFPDATILPFNTPENNSANLSCLPPRSNGNATRCTNRGASITDDLGQAQVTLIAGLTLGRMRVTAEAPRAINISSAVSVMLTAQGFLSGGTLTIIPATATFVNPLVSPGTDGPMTIFNAVGGTPPYRWDNVNKDIGRIEPQGLPNINEKAKYTLTGPSPANTTDTVILLDAAGNQATATVEVIFADCQLKADGQTITIEGASGGATFRIDVGDGVPPFTVTDEFPGTVAAQTICDASQRNCTILFTLPTPPRPVDPDNILIRDARGCTANIELTVSLCGNGAINGTEECDGSDFGGQTCASFTGKPLGSLRCTDTCTIDTSNCSEPPAP
jgi:hypothetical protein